MMDKAFLPSSVPIQETLESAVRKIPLPNQMPKGIDFADLPVSHLKSATLETLINQNEDLMARLSIALRRTSEYEEKTSRLEQETSNMRSRFETLKEQYMLTQEKDRIATSRSLQVHEENVSTKGQFEKLEKVYSELFIQAQAFQKRVIGLERNQARLRKAARSIQKANKMVPSLRRALDEAAASEQQIAYTHQQSVQSYEAKLTGVRQEVESMRTKISERDALFAEKVKLENDLVFKGRQFEVKSDEQQALVDRLSSENTSMRVQLKESLIATEAARQESERLSHDLPSLRNEKQNLIEQVESLQALWSHKQTELEGMEQKNKALQKLNQSISLTLNQQRKEIHGLEQELEKERFQAAEKVKNLLAEIQMLRAKD